MKQERVTNGWGSLELFLALQNVSKLGQRGILKIVSLCVFLSVHEHATIRIFTHLTSSCFFMQELSSNERFQTLENIRHRVKIIMKAITQRGVRTCRTFRCQSVEMKCAWLRPGRAPFEKPTDEVHIAFSCEKLDNYMSDLFLHVLLLTKWDFFGDTYRTRSSFLVYADLETPQQAIFDETA